MVLRFNITTAEEASALAEASSILFLDVWEFSDDWVDIRIAKDNVSGTTSPHSMETVVNVKTGRILAWSSSLLSPECACPSYARPGSGSGHL
jgi:hypothetical protein